MVVDFDAAAQLHRSDLLALCYRMLGRLDDAEDAVQETYLRAWRAYGRFDGRSSVRTWLHRIATNVCLTALERRGRAPDPYGDVDPVPDALLDPAAIVGGRAGLRLALVAALQHLPATQRAVLILRDVLAWPAAEVGDLLGLSVPAVKSALQRARGTVARLAPAEAELAEPAVLRPLVDRYAAAFENADAAGLAELLRADATLHMPPLPESYVGRAAVTGFLAARMRGHAVRMLPTRANGQPALATYLDGTAHALHVLDVAGGAVAGIVVFLDPGLVARFDLPPTLR